MTAVKADNGEITGAVLLFRDITNRKQAQSPVIAGAIQAVTSAN